MRKLVGVTQRVAVVAEYQERRDAIDQRWAEFFAYCDLVPVYLPNHLVTINRLLESLPFDGFVLTGGNSLASLGGDAPERDETETRIIEFAIGQHKPLLGVCRGMQMIQHYFDIPLQRIEGHVSKLHRITGSLGERTVNSYHQFGATNTHDELLITAQSDDGMVESLRHRQLPMQGIMWHPERSSPFDPLDKELVTKLFGS